MLGCIDLKYDPEVPSASDTAPNDNRKTSTVNTKLESNDNELVTQPPAAINHKRPGRCPFKQCISDTFDVCHPPTIADQPTASKPPPIETARRNPITRKNVDQERSAAILQKLGILHLDDKLTRPRSSVETEEHILREAGAARYFIRRGEDDDDEEYEGADYHQRPNMKFKQLTEREAQILKEAGVLMVHPIEPCGTATTATVGTSDSYVTYAERSPSDEMTTRESANPTMVNSTYAEKELLRRLKNGWMSNGMDCAECGMPVICRRDGGDEGWMECVICGVVEVPEEFEAHVTFGGGEVEESFSCLDTTITSGFTMMNHDQKKNTMHCSTCRKELDSDAPTIMSLEGRGENEVHSPVFQERRLQKSDTNSTSMSEDAIKKELGSRIFAGWTVLSSNCPRCNLPLISDGKDCPSVCLRCE